MSQALRHQNLNAAFIPFGAYSISQKYHFPNVWNEQCDSLAKLHHYGKKLYLAILRVYFVFGEI